jgi:hypothetical protein
MDGTIALPGAKRAALLAKTCCALAVLAFNFTLGAYDIIVGWQPVSDPGVVGYNFYYGIAPGVYFRQIPCPEPVVTLFDLPDSLTYYAMVTSYDTNGVESAPSEELAFSRVASDGLGPKVNLATNGMGYIAANLDTETLAPGRTCTLTAQPRPGQIFAGWVGSINASTPKISFVLASNMLLQANFISNPFPVASGIYNGLFYESGQMQQESSGSFSLNVTARGTYSGRLQIGGHRLGLSGQLNFACQGTKALSLAGSPSLSLQFGINSGAETNTISGSVSCQSWNANLIGDRATFNSRTNPFPLAGTYTLVFPGQDDDASQPAGDGYAAVRINSSGVAVAVCSLADGSKLTQSAPLSPQWNWPFYAPLYSGEGMLLSWLTLADSNGGQISGLVNWIKPGNARASYYPAGFAYQTNAFGSAYQRPATSSAPPLDFTSANLAFIGGALPASFTNPVTLVSASRAFPQNSSHLTLSFVTSSGLFKGSVADPSGAGTYQFSGALLQPQAGYGFLLHASQSSRVILSP